MTITIRTEAGRKYAPAATVGIDTVRVSAKVDPFDAPNGYQVGGQSSISYDWLETGVMVQYGPDQSVALEFSAPNLALGTNDHPLALDDLHPLIRDVFAESHEQVRWRRDGDAIDYLHLRVARIDIVRDFHDVEHLPLILDGLDHLARATRGRQTRERGKAQQLSIGPARSWQGKLYDKHAQSSTAASGTLRFEATLRHARLIQEWAATHGGIVDTVADLTHDSILPKGRATFDALGFAAGIPLGGPGIIIVPSDIESASSTVMIVGLRAVPSLFHTLSPKTKTRYRPWVLGPFQDGDVMPEHTVRLDFDSGCEVTTRSSPPPRMVAA